jgi:hypothetical protein
MLDLMELGVHSLIGCRCERDEHHGNIARRKTMKEGMMDD